MTHIPHSAPTCPAAIDPKVDAGQPTGRALPPRPVGAIPRYTSPQINAMVDALLERGTPIDAIKRRIAKKRLEIDPFKTVRNRKKRNLIKAAGC